MILDRIKDYCNKENLSIYAFEEKYEFGNGTIAEWGKDSMPSMKSLMKISEIIGIPLSELVKDYEEKA